MPSLQVYLNHSASFIFSLKTFCIEGIHIFAETRFLPTWAIFHWEVISDLFASEFYSEFPDQLKDTFAFRDDYIDCLMIVSAGG